MAERADRTKDTESVWDYPRPPRLEPAGQNVEVWFNGRKVAASDRAYRVLETSHPPVYYIPLEDCEPEYLGQSDRETLCEFKGKAQYFHVKVAERMVPDAAWYYPSPVPAFEALRNHVAFYPSKMDACTVDGEPVSAQEGDFYGGWITANIEGPFKGPPGTTGW